MRERHTLTHLIDFSGTNQNVLQLDVHVHHLLAVHVVQSLAMDDELADQFHHHVCNGQAFAHLCNVAQQLAQHFLWHLLWRVLVDNTA